MTTDVDTGHGRVGPIDLPRVPLALLPTAFYPLARLSDAIGAQVWIKRDDLTGLALGGNKARKLEYLIGDALEHDADVLVVAGGPESNNILQATAAAVSHGLDVVLALYGNPPPPGSATNLELARRLGADVRFSGDDRRESSEATLDLVARELRQAGRRPYALPRGGATPIGTAGYVTAATEMFDQFRERRLAPSDIVVAVGSCGTYAGLALGFARHGEGPHIVGITVSRTADECRQQIDTLGRGCGNLIGATWPGPSAVDIRDQFLGGGYGVPTPDSQAAAALAGETEGLLLDRVYTAKAMAGLIAGARAGHFRGPVVFLHTGGAGDLMERSP